MSDMIFAHKDQYERELETWYVSKYLDGEMKGLCYENVLPLNVTFAYSDEPVPFEELKT